MLNRKETQVERTSSKISKNKENVIHNVLSSSKKIPIMVKSAKKSENENYINHNNAYNNISPLSFPNKIKRKFNEFDQSTSQSKYLKNKIDEFYDKFTSGHNTSVISDWKDEFLFELRQENILDLNSNIPKSLNTKGSHLLEYTKFWILFIEIKFPDFGLQEIIHIFNSALNYDQNCPLLLYEYFIKIMEDNFEKKEIHEGLLKMHPKNSFRAPVLIEDLKNDHFKYLLERPDFFNELKYSISGCTQSKKKERTTTPKSEKAVIYVGDILESRIKEINESELSINFNEIVIPSSQNKFNIPSKIEESNKSPEIGNIRKSIHPTPHVSSFSLRKSLGENHSSLLKMIQPLQVENSNMIESLNEIQFLYEGKEKKSEIKIVERKSIALGPSSNPTPNNTPYKLQDFYQKLIKRNNEKLIINSIDIEVYITVYYLDNWKI
jgi:hypothetical protein